MDKHPKYRNVLIARFSALGDVAMTVPVVYSACRAFPQTRFVMITLQVASSLFVIPPENLVIIGVVVLVKYHGPKGLLKLFRELRAEYDIDAFVDLHSVIRTHILSLYCRLWGVPVKRIRKGRGVKRELTRRHHKQLHQLCSSRDRYFDVFRRSGFDFGEAFTSLFSTPVDQQQFADITPPKKDGETWIAIAPFAIHAGKIYSTEKMAELVATLAARPATKIFLFGGGGDEQLKLREWAGQHDNVISMAEKRHGFPKELALLSCVDAMVSMDSANMHLASLVQVPVVSVWGATHPFCGFTGWKQSPDNAVQLDLDCRPCSVFGNKPCYRGDYRCLNGIAPEAIVRKVETVLKSKRR